MPTLGGGEQDRNGNGRQGGHRSIGRVSPVDHCHCGIGRHGPGCGRRRVGRLASNTAEHQAQLVLLPLKRRD